MVAASARNMFNSGHPKYRDIMSEWLEERIFLQTVNFVLEREHGIQGRQLSWCEGNPRIMALNVRMD